MLKKAGKYITALLRGVSFVLALTVAAGSLGVTLGASAEEVYSLDYTSVAGGQTAKAPQGDIVSGLLSEGLLAAERNYLDSHGSCTVEYTSDVPAGYYTATMLDGKIYAVARPYKYTAFNGQTVSFTPVYAEVGNSRMPLLWSQRDGAYCAFLDGARRDEVKFTFAASIEIPDDAALVMINEAYTAAVAMDTAQGDYDSAQVIWSDKNERYQDYLDDLNAYNTAKDAYEQYEKDKIEYETDLQNYNEWWEEYDKQNALREKYELDYSRYEENQNALMEYDRQLEEYESYMALVDASPDLVAEYEAKAVAAQKHLNIIDSFYKEITPKRHSFWGVISSSFVKFVFENRDEIISLGGKREDIQKAEEAHYYLVQIFEAYGALETKAEKYEFLTSNLEDMKYYLTRLGDALKDIASVERVMNRVSAEGLKDEFLEFVGIIYYCECALYDDKTFDANEKYYDTALSSVLEISQLVADEDSLVPLDGGWPTPPLTADDVTPVEHPGVRPTELSEPAYVAPPPDKSTAPEKPTPPEDVEDPGDVPPTEVEHPGAEPQAPVRDSTEEALYGEYLNGKISYRTSVSSHSTQIYTSAAKKADTVRIQVSVHHEGSFVGDFYIPFGESAESALNALGLQLGDRVISGKTYEFVGWSDTPNGDTVDVSYISSASGALSLYSVYRLKLTETETVTETEQGSDESTHSTEDDEESSTPDGADSSETESAIETETEESVQSQTSVAESDLQTEDQTTPPTDTESTPESTDDGESESVSKAESGGQSESHSDEPTSTPNTPTTSDIPDGSSAADDDTDAISDEDNENLKIEEIDESDEIDEELT